MIWCRRCRRPARRPSTPIQPEVRHIASITMENKEGQAAETSQGRQEADDQCGADRQLGERHEKGDPSGVGDHETMQETPPPAVGGDAVVGEARDPCPVVVKEGRVLSTPHLRDAGLQPHDAQPDAHGGPDQSGRLGALEPIEGSRRRHPGRVPDEVGEGIHRTTCFLGSPTQCRAKEARFWTSTPTLATRRRGQSLPRAARLPGRSRRGDQRVVAPRRLRRHYASVARMRTLRASFFAALPKTS